MHNAPSRVRDRAQQTAKMPRIYDVCIAVRRLYAMPASSAQKLPNSYKAQQLNQHKAGFDVVGGGDHVFNAHFLRARRTVFNNGTFVIAVSGVRRGYPADQLIRHQ